MGWLGGGIWVGYVDGDVDGDGDVDVDGDGDSGVSLLLIITGIYMRRSWVQQP